MNIAHSKTYPRSWTVNGAALLMLAAGVIHFIIIPHHWGHAPAHGIAMGVIGLLEVIWAFVYWSRPSRRVAQIGVILAVSFISLWVITRIAPAPYTNEAEEVDFSGILTQVLEAISAIILLAVAARTVPEAGGRRTTWRIILAVLLISVMLGAGVYEAARLTQPLFPQLSPSSMEHMDEP